MSSTGTWIRSDSCSLLPRATMNPSSSPTFTCYYRRGSALSESFPDNPNRTTLSLTDILLSDSPNLHDSKKGPIRFYLLGLPSGRAGLHFPRGNWICALFPSFHPHLHTKGRKGLDPHSYNFLSFDLVQNPAQHRARGYKLSRL